MVAAQHARLDMDLADTQHLASAKQAALIDASPDEAIDRLLRVARAAAGAPIALISFLTDGRQFVKSSLGLPKPLAGQREIPPTYSFCQHVVQRGQVLLIDDARQAPPSMPADLRPLGIGAYAGWPLAGDQSQTIGCLCMIDPAPRDWQTVDLGTLRDLAAAIETTLVLQRRSRGAAAAARASEERLRLIAHATRDVVYDMDVASGDIWWSRGLLTLAGYGADEPTNSLAWWRAHLHPDERGPVADSLDAVLNNGGQFWSKEYRFRRKDGTYVRLFDRGYVVNDEAGKPAHFVGAMSDISGHRETEYAFQESEARFRQLAETATEGVWFLDAFGRTTFVNQQLADMLGRSRQEIMGASIFDLMEPPDRAAAGEELARRRQGAHDRLEIRFRRPDGSDVWTLVSAGPIRDSEGQDSGSFALVADNTERRRAEQERAQQVANLRALYQASQAIVAELDPARVYALAHEAVGKLMEAPVFYIALLDEARSEVEEVYMFDRGLGSCERYALDHRNLTTHVLKTGQPLRYDDDIAGASYALGADRFGGEDDTRSLMLAPLHFGDRVIGVMSVQSYQPNAYSDAQEQLFRTLANQVAVAIANARLVQSLRDSEGRFRQLAETIQQFFWIANADGSQLLYASPSYEIIWGRPAGDLYADAGVWLASVHPDDRVVFKAWQAEWGTKSGSLEYRILRPDGQVRWIWSQAFAVRDAGGIVYRVTGISEDVTERRIIEDALARERDLLQALMDGSPDTIYFKDRDSRFTRINEAQRLVLGVDSAEAAVGRSDADFFDAPLADAFKQEEQEMVRTGRPVLDRVEYNPTHDGEARWFSATKVPLRDRAGQVIGLVGVSRDITARKLAEIELQAQKDLFENLVAVARATMSLPTLEATLQNTLDVSVRLSAAARGSLFLVDDRGGVTHSLLSGGQTKAPGRRTIIDQVMRDGLAGWVVRQRTPALLADTAEDSRWAGSPDPEYGTRSALSVPIHYRDTVLGVLTLQHGSPGHFQPAQLDLMQAAADQMALALRNARMFDETEMLAYQMTMLNHITRAALEAGTLEDLYQSLADRVGELFTASNCHITAWDESLGVEVARASSDPSWRERYGSIQLRPGEATLSQSALAEGRVLAVNDTLDTPYMSRRIAELFPAKSALALPLIARERKLGAILLDFHNPRHFNPEEISLAERTGRQVALALSTALLFQEAAEERSRLQAIIHTSRDGIALVGLDNRVLICNAPTLDMLALSGGADDWLGKPLRAALTTLRHSAPHIARAAMTEMRRMLRSGDQPGEGEFTIGARYIHWISLPVVASAALVGRLLIMRDVTGERELQTLRNDLAHMMVHDLRSPLSAIVSAADVLVTRRTGLTETDRELASIIREGADRMSGLVGDILDVSQLESGQMPLHCEPMAIDPAVAEALHLQSGAMQAKNIRLREQTTPAAPLVWADPQLIGRVLQNLLGNAVKFTSQDGEIGLTAEVDGGWLQISVVNTGMGVPPEVKERLFSKFARGSQKERGNGLGLAFCRLAVEAHHGRIWVESEPGQGAAFRFTLPLYQPGH
jgi:NtrC-family two-component system sensor histidine kinase KinB